MYYTYDADAQRVSKDNGTDVTSYIRGADGQTIATYVNGTVDKWNLISGGDIVGTAENGSAFIEYFIKDHLGSTRAIENNINSPVAYYDFYPFGKLMSGRHTTSSDDRYKFTGHELDSDAGIDLSYAGARYLDSEIGSWLSIDPMVDKYPGLSPYNYTMNNPLNGLDPTGNAVIFVNGFPFDGNVNRSYWGSFAEDLMKRFPGERDYFFDGGRIIKNNGKTSSVSLWGFSGRLGSVISSDLYYGSGSFDVRKKAGYKDGQKRAKEIINNLSRDDEGDITESIKIVTHSMGAAYSRGLIEALKEYATENNIEGLNIDFIIDIAAYQGDDISNSFIKSFQVGSPFDFLARNRKIDSSKRIDGSNKWFPGHRLSHYSANRIIDNVISWARANDIPLTIRE